MRLIFNHDEESENPEQEEFGNKSAKQGKTEGMIGNAHISVHQEHEAK